MEQFPHPEPAQQKDKSECYGWTSQQRASSRLKSQRSNKRRVPERGNNANRLSRRPHSRSKTPKGQGVGGAARDAAGGAIVGAIAGDAG
jgi:hypothetical protein